MCGPAVAGGLQEDRNQPIPGLIDSSFLQVVFPEIAELRRFASLPKLGPRLKLVPRRTRVPLVMVLGWVRQLANRVILTHCQCFESSKTGLSEPRGISRGAKW